jgi:fructose-bisphosphate aldolase class II
MPLNGAKTFQAFKDHSTSILAANTRIIPGVTSAIFKACQKTNAVVFIELSKSECDLDGGYTGLTPQSFSKLTYETAQKIGFDHWVLHSDHNTLKDFKDIQNLKKLLKIQLDNYYTSFLLDSSPLFEPHEIDTKKKIKNNLKATLEIYQFLKNNSSQDFGFEVEFNPIAKNQSEIVLTQKDEALTFIKTLKASQIEPHALAISNGSIHGNIYDTQGNIADQNKIDLRLTHQIAEAFRKEGIITRIAQHGTSGIPLDFIKKHFSKKDVIKINVATAWQETFFEALSQAEPLLYEEIYHFTLQKFQKKEKNIHPKIIFRKNVKHVLKDFFEKFFNLKPQNLAKIESQIFKLAILYIDALNLKNSAKFLN